MNLIPPTVLISTVGASLIGSLEKPPASAGEQQDALNIAFLAENWPAVVRELRIIDPTARRCGAEINTVHELLYGRHPVSKTADLHFCVSETPYGETMKQLLKLYYETSENRVLFHTIEGLQDQDENRFRRIGLRSLVQKIADITRRAGGSEFVAINATGGYKAQIALAAIIGQALGITVYYKHEMFPGVIALPPMPVSFDFDLFGREAGILLALEQNDEIFPGDLEINEQLLPLLDEVEEGGQRLAGLSAMGQLYLEGFRLRNPPEKTLPPAVLESDKRTPTFRDDHYPDGFKEYVAKVWRETPYIKSCHSVPYDGQRGIRDRVFYLRPKDNDVIGEFRHDNFGARFAITTSATGQGQKLAVVDDLSRRYGRG